MMNKRAIIISLSKIKKITILVFVLILGSCSKPSVYESVNSSNIGESGQSENSRSHNSGQNCMNCHKPGGGEAPTWNIAGTVYNEDRTTFNSRATIKLYTGPNGTGILKYTLTADATGNFYTSSAIDFGGGLYPVASGATTTNYMSSPITVGACNSCHTGVDTGRVWIK